MVIKSNNYSSIVVGDKSLCEWSDLFNNQFSPFELYRIVSEGGCLSKMYVEFSISK